jgi:hypothetical protein
LAGEDAARHERPVPRNKRLKQDEEEDAPTYVLEDSNQSLTKAEYEALLSGKDPDKLETTDGEKKEEAEASETAAKEQQPKDKITEVGKASKKRKAAKVIGGEVAADVEKESKPAKKPKKKAKAVKLSFGDDEG